MIDLEFHPESFLLTPLIGIQKGECTDRSCAADHWLIALGWFVWTVNIIFET